MPDPAVIEYATFIRAEPARVFDAFATAEGLDGWFTSGAIVEPEGRILFRWKNWGVHAVTGESGGEVLAWNRPDRFAFHWNPVRGQPDQLTRVDLTFTPREGGTVVAVRDAGFPPTPEGNAALVDCAAGWGEALTLAKFYLEHGLRYECP